MRRRRRRGGARRLRWCFGGEGGARKFGNEGTGRERADAGVLRCALASLCRMGQDTGDARPLLATALRAGSAPIGHQASRFSSRETEMGRLTAGFQVEQTLNPWTSSQNFLNQICRPMYQLQYLFKALVLIRNRNRVKSCSRSACQAVRDPGLRKIR